VLNSCVKFDAKICPINQSINVPCQNSGVGGSHGFLLASFSHHLNEVQRSKPTQLKYQQKSHWVTFYRAACNVDAV